VCAVGKFSRLINTHTYTRIITSLFDTKEQLA
jgi:hypothetical protein